MQNIFYYLLFFFIFIASIFIIQHMQKKEESTITTQAMTLDQREKAKALMLKVAHATWELEQPFEQFTQGIHQTDEFNDIDDLENVYLNNKGTFLVLMDGNKIIGTGGIKRINETTCELKRMFIQPEYQGRGLGTALLQELITFAKHQGYKKIKLDVWKPDKQQAAIHLYTKFGFYRINSSNNNQSGKVIMEKKLNENKTILPFCQRKVKSSPYKQSEKFRFSL